MKRIRRMRVRTETGKFLIVQSQTERSEPESPDASEICPTCGRKFVGSLIQTTALPIDCSDKHDETKLQGVLKPEE